MDAAVNTTDPEREKIKSLQSEIRNLRTKGNERTLAYPLETRIVAFYQLLGYMYGG